MRVEILAPSRSVIGRALIRERMVEPTRQGLHLSTIVNDIAASMEPSRVPFEAYDTTALSFQAIGVMIEDVVAGELRRRARWSKPVPRTYRGIICSPDGVRESDEATIVDEIKVRWGSCREFIGVDGVYTAFETYEVGELTAESATFIKYRMQLLFYMSAWDATDGELHILFLNGTFRPPFPKPVTIRLFPTRQELHDNADLIVQHARDRGWL